MQVKTHLQAQANETIAVGHQHPHKSMSHGLYAIYSKHGITGLWKGVSGAIPRVTIGSAAQLSSFSTIKEEIIKTKVSVIYSKNWIWKASLDNIALYDFLF